VLHHTNRLAFTQLAFERPALGDVVHAADDGDRFPPGVDARLDELLDVLFAPVPEHQATLGRGIGRARRNVFLTLDELRTVFRMDLREKIFERRRVGGRVLFEDPVQLVRPPARVRREVPLPVADLREPLRLTVAYFREPQRGLARPLLRDVL